MEGSTVQIWLNHPGVIDRRRSLEIPYRLHQYAALMWNNNERDTTVSGDRLTMYDGGRYPFDPVTFIGPAGECRFDAGASWDELGGVQAVIPPPSIQEIHIENAVPETVSKPQPERVQVNKMIELPPVHAEVAPRFSPLFCMAFGGDENEVKEFGYDGDDEDDDEFMMEEYDFEELESNIDYE